MQSMEQEKQDNPSRFSELLTRLSEEMNKPKPELSQEEWRQQALERAKQDAERYNKSAGDLKDGHAESDGRKIPGDGYDCPLCLNRGNYMTVLERNGMIYQPMTECKCMNIRRAIWRLKQSGLEDSIKEYTFKRFENRGPWCEALVKKAKAFLAEGVDAGAWLYFGGQPGCGKTHICTAVCRELLAKMPVYYMLWTTESKKLRAIVNDAEDYERELRRLEDIDVLYIDDLFKPTKNDKGEIVLPTSAEMKLAFELINFRDVTKKTTIISSEWFLDELIDLDEATGSRIAKRSRGYHLSIARDREKNYRIASIETV